MNFYAYFVSGEINDKTFTDEPLGTDNRMIWKDLKTVHGAVSRIQEYLKAQEKGWKIFSFTNFYDNKTFKLVALKPKNGQVILK